MPVIANKVAPAVLMDVVSCGCKAEGKTCQQRNCKCQSEGLSCTEYCNCSGGELCHNPHTNIAIEEESDDETDEEDVS